MIATEIAEQNGMSREFADWFFDNKKAGCGNVWFMMMAAMWEGNNHPPCHRFRVSMATLR